MIEDPSYSDFFNLENKIYDEVSEDCVSDELANC